MLNVLNLSIVFNVTIDNAFEYDSKKTNWWD